MRPQLVIGATGLVGAQLAGALTRAGCSAIGTYHTLAARDLLHLDIRDRAQVLRFVAEVAPTAVFLAGAATNVEWCEEHPREAWLTNVLGTRHVIEAAETAGARLVFLSTDYIFDGTAGPYREDDRTCPVNEYGRQKLAAEQEVSRDARDSLIVRTTAVYGRERRGKNFVTALTSALRAGRSVRVPADQIGNPTYAPNLADVVVELANSGTRGVANVAGPDRVSRLRLALEAAAVFGLDPGLIVATSTPELGQRAARPLDAGFVVDRTRALTTLPLVGYREGLRLMAAEERP